MRFNAGYFGTCAVVLALLGTVLAGFVLSIDKETVPYTNYDYVTDVSGLFSYDETPAYVDYNPSTNYVGYTAVTGTVGFTTSSTANNYRYVVNAGDTWTGSYSFTQAKTFDYDYARAKGWINYDDEVRVPPIFIKWVGTEVTIPDYMTYARVDYQGLINSVRNDYNPQYLNVASLQSVISEITAEENPYKTLEIDITQTGTYPVLFYAGGWISAGGLTPGASRPSVDMDESNSLPTKLIVDNATLNVTAYRDDTLIWESTANNVAVISHYRGSGSGYDDVNTGVTFDMTYTGVPVYGYMNPNDGVTIDGSNISSSGWRAITWSNGYENDKVTFKVLLNYENNNYKNIALNVYSGTSSSSQFSIQNDIHGAHFYYDRNGSYHPETLGYWPAVQVTLYASENKIVVTPTTDTSLLTVVDEQPYSFTLSNYLPAGTIDKIVFKNYLTASDPNRTATWQITSTSVFLNTYDTVMKDPSINIVSQFPDIYRDYRLNFYSFALYGESFTINGTNFAVDRNNATVTFQYGGQAVTQYLNNIYVTVDDLHTYLTFANVNQRYDLGATTTHVISFAGYWYFTTGLYEPVEGLQTVYNWDLNGAFHADAGQCLVIFFAILVGCVLIAHTYFKVNLRVYDWLIIGFAGFFAYVYFGGLIV